MTACKVMVMAGGTGGHVFPALAVADELRRLGAEVVWLGTRAGLEAEKVPAAGYPMEWLRISGLRGKGVLRWLSAPFRILFALAQAVLILRRVRPQAVLGMGGFVSGPGGIAARLLRLPLLIHEQNAVAGLTNRWLSRVTTRAMEAFPGALPGRAHAVAIGNPVRVDIAALPAPAERLAGRHGTLRLLVLGGSLGAQAINEVVPAMLQHLLPEVCPEVWHQTGARNLLQTQVAYRKAEVMDKAPIRIVPFIEDMAEAYAWADLVLCRAGALTVSELAAVGVASLLVPYPHAVDDHQTENANYLTRAGAAIKFKQHELRARDLADLMVELRLDRPRLLAMAEKARAKARPEATAEVAHICLQVCGADADSAVAQGGAE